MRILIASDHAGFELKQKLMPFLRGLGYEVFDKGAFSFVPDDDYPDFVRQVAEEISKSFQNSPFGKGSGESASRGILENLPPRGLGTSFKLNPSLSEQVLLTEAVRSLDFLSNKNLPKNLNEPCEAKTFASHPLQKGDGGITDEIRGIVIGKSGEGEAMCANRFPNVRAAVYYGGSPEILKLSREHNDANVLSLGAGFVSESEAKTAVKLWLATPFSGDTRHVRRIAKIDANT